MQGTGTRPPPRRFAGETAQRAVQIRHCRTAAGNPPGDGAGVANGEILVFQGRGWLGGQTEGRRSEDASLFFATPLTGQVIYLLTKAPATSSNSTW